MSLKAKLAKFFRGIDFVGISKVLLPLLGLAGIAGFFARWVLPFVVGRAEKQVDKELEKIETREIDHEKNVEVVKEAHKKIDALKPDSTSKEIDEAIDDSLSQL